jgi:hypothetical protein
MPDIGRNDPCSCGSGKKYKKCCEAKDAAKHHTELEKQWKASEKKFEKTKEEESSETSKAPTQTVPGHKSLAKGKTVAPKHNTFAAPKFQTPRKAGGGA